jgi:hypothetical protein
MQQLKKTVLYIVLFAMFRKYGVSGIICFPFITYIKIVDIWLAVHHSITFLLLPT